MNRFLSGMLLLLAVTARSVMGDCVLPQWTRGSVLNRQATRVHAANLNGDNKADVIGHTASSIFVALNDGTGLFAAMTDVHAGDILGPVVIGDFTGDTKTDIAFGTNGSLVVLPGFGDGTFAAAVTTTIAITPSITIAATVDPGNTLDLLVYDTILNVLVRYTNAGSGQFAEASRTTILSDQETFVAADFDGDGRTDTFVASPYLTNYDGFFADANGAFGSATPIRGALSATKLAAADLDGNGLPDLLVSATTAIVALRNLGGRQFTDPLRYADSTQLFDVEAADFTGDGAVDAATFNSGCRFRIWKGTGVGTFTLSSSLPFSTPESCFSASRADAAVADFDGDGRLDLVFSTDPNGVPQVRFYRNRCGDSRIFTDVHTPLITAGQEASVTAGVANVAYGYTTTPTGTVSILENGVTLGTGTLAANEATLELSGLALGVHELVATYDGNAQYEPNESEPFTITVTAQTTTTTLAITPEEGQYGHGPVIQAQVTASNGQTPTGQMRITIDGTRHTQGRGPTLSTEEGTTSSTIGTHTVVAEFLGDATHPPSRVTRNYVIGRQTPKIEASRASAVAGQTSQIELTIETSGYVQLHATGTISIGLGSTTFDTETLQTQRATLSLPALPAGRHMLRARYAGDASFAPVETWLPYIVFPATGESVDARGTAAGVTVTWNSSKPYVQRRLPDETWSHFHNICCPEQPWLDTVPDPETVFLYRMADDTGAATYQDVGMRIAFTDDPLLPGTVIRSTHLLEIVRAANILRAAAALPAISAAPFQVRSPIAASPLLALRAAINEARVTLGAIPYTFSSTIGSRLIVRAADLQELREAVR